MDSINYYLYSNEKMQVLYFFVSLKTSFIYSLQRISRGDYNVYVIYFLSSNFFFLLTDPDISTHT